MDAGNGEMGQASGNGRDGEGKPEAEGTGDDADDLKAGPMRGSTPSVS